MTTTEISVALSGESLITRALPMAASQDAVSLRRLVSSADVAFTHLEVVCPTSPLVPRPRSQGIHVHADPRVLDEVRSFGFNLISLAHHHALDYGASGLMETIEALGARNLTNSGAGATLSQARRPRYLEVSGVRASLLAACSTDADETCASDPDGLVEGRPGINPLRFKTQYEVTREQLHALSEIDETLGTAVGSRTRRELSLDLGDNASESRSDAPRLSFLGLDFVQGPETRVRTRARPDDVEGIVRWISEARRQSDLVIVSLHCHEGPNGTSNSDAVAEFAVDAFHRFVAAGADICVGHGPHQLGAIEIYEGRPIFHSLGNFIFMVETVELFPAEFLETAGLPSDATAADFHDHRETAPDGSARGFVATPAYWETVVPICQFEGGQITNIDLWPVELDRGPKRSHRGVPSLASSKTSGEILGRLTRLSEPFGTRIAQVEIDQRRVGRIAM